MSDPVELRLYQCMNALPDNRRLEFQMAYQSQRKNRGTALLLAIFLGEFGVDRFYLGQTGLGVMKLISLGGWFVWWFFDCILIMSAADAHNNRLIDRLWYMYNVAPQVPQYPQPQLYAQGYNYGPPPGA